jgi:hypothetical protein
MSWERPKKNESGLDLRTAAGLRNGGDSGQPSIVPGQPEKSPLYIAVLRLQPDDWEPMQPKEKDSSPRANRLDQGMNRRRCAGDRSRKSRGQARDIDRRSKHAHAHFDAKSRT